MNRTLFSFLFFMTVLTLTVSPVIADSAEQAKEEFAAADAKLNNIYQQILGELKHKKWTGNPDLNRDCVTAFIKAERAWVVFRDAESELANVVFSAESGHGGAWPAFARERDLTEERIKSLQQFMQQKMTDAATNEKAGFTGSWGSKADDAVAFSLDLTQAGNHIEGYHSAVAQHGNRIDAVTPDDGQPSITGDVSEGVAHLRFRSGYSDATDAATGEATITISGNTLEWKITKSSGVHYLPTSSTLYRR